MAHSVPYWRNQRHTWHLATTLGSGGGDESMANPPHRAQGMIQEFVVTAEGTEVGPLPAELVSG
jgi:hypothetical protein